MYLIEEDDLVTYKNNVNYSKKLLKYGGNWHLLKNNNNMYYFL